AARYLKRERFDHPLVFPIPAVADPRFAAAMRTYAGHGYREWLYDLGEPCYLEPIRGFVLSRRGEWLVDSFLYHHRVEQTPYQGLVELLRRRGAVETLDCAVSMRCTTEGNYWHFYDDFLTKLRLIDELDLPQDVPLLVGETMWRRPFFQAAIRGPLSQRNWVRHTALLDVRRLIVAVPMSLQRTNLEYSRRALEAPGPVSSERRIFLDRGPGHSRGLTNAGELVPMLREDGFEIVDIDGLDLRAQMTLFGTARLVVANHGAALANLIYRVGQPVDLLELFGPEFIRPHFAWMAQAFDFGYDALVGEATGDDGGFRIAPGALRRAVRDMSKTI
ncbi:MAG TPA: glycosyltransferase family 61 protein, partial [Gemmatimonadales bacterium]|nr:glycosyltransferase family 61 protein [Gemmatimonadales bacterium]